MNHAEWLTEYDAWQAERTRLGDAEGASGVFYVDDWQASDDQGIELTRSAHELISAVANAADDMTPANYVHLDCWSDTSFTCTEADALVALLRSAGLNDHADSLAEYHADSDVEGDEHYTGDAS